MKFTLAVYTADVERVRTALGFTEALLAEGHSLYRLFFFGDGVRNGVAASGNSAEDELRRRWQALIQAQGLDAILCVTSAQKRGLDIGDGVAESKLAVAEGFTISGLGQLVDAAVQADRLITFGD